MGAVQGVTRSSDQGSGGETPDSGLTRDEASLRLKIHGRNEFGESTKKGVVSQLARTFVTPLSLILLFASLVSVATGDVLDSGLIILIVLLGGIISFRQERRSQQLIEKLKVSVSPTASVIREGQTQELPRSEVVPGDMILLSPGDLVPADSVLVATKDLHLQEAALTGESLPVEKTTGNPVFLGSSVVSGTGRAVVQATGLKTQFGEIAAKLEERPPETEFDRGMRRFGLLIAETVFALTVAVLIVNLALDRGLLESLLFSVALAVGLTPEFLPVIVAVTLSVGAAHMARRKVIIKRLVAIQNLGSVDILCSDKTGTLTAGEMSLASVFDLLGTKSRAAEELAWFNSRFETGIKSPLDSAILKKLDFPAEGIEKIDEIPFDFERRRLSVVIEKAAVRRIIVKGAPENLLALCNRYEAGGVVRDLDDEAVRAYMRHFETSSMQGNRVLAVAAKEIEKKSAYAVSDESGLVFHGFLSFLDTPLEDAGEAIQEMERDGVKIKVLSGDNELVARHVCEQVGLDASRVVLGSEIDGMTDSALGKVAETCNVFARVSPAHKSRIIIALKMRGHVVGYMGDGINDAPSLSMADVGISFSSAVDVAKEASSVILLEKDLRVLHAGIEEGRKAFGNVMKYLLMGTSSNFGNMFSMAVASAFLPFLPMLPFQIILNNFLYDLAQIMIPTDRVDSSFTVKPRKWDIGLLGKFMVSIGPISSVYDFMTFFVLLHWLKASESLFHSGWFVESLVTQTLVIFVIRTMGNPFKSRPSQAITLTVTAIVLLAIAIPYLPPMKRLGFTPLPPVFMGFLVVAAGSYLWLVEVIKRRLFSYKLEGIHVCSGEPSGARGETTHFRA